LAQRVEDSLIVESARVSIDRLNEKIGFNPSRKIDNSTSLLQNRNYGIDLVSAFDSSQQFYE
jgi:hypothetical protein